jgi:hypothetical protein
LAAKKHKGIVRKGITETLNAVYANQDERVDLDPVLEHLQDASIVREEW